MHIRFKFVQNDGFISHLQQKPPKNYCFRGLFIVILTA